MYFRLKTSIALCFGLTLALSSTGSSKINLSNKPTIPATSASDTEKIAFISDSDGYPKAYLINSDGSDISSIGNIEQGGTVDLLSWSADGSHIALSVSYETKNSEIVMVDLSTGTQDKYTIPDNIDAVYTAISPDAKEVAWASPQPLGVSRVNVIRWSDKASHLLTDFSPNDTIIREERYPHWSPDGKYIAFVNDGPQSSEIYLVYPDGSNRTVLVGNVAPSSDFVWAPNSQSVAFTANSGELCTIGIDKSKQHCFDTPKNAYDPDWSPDGNSIVAVGTSKDKYDVYVIDLASGKVDQITQRDSLIETPKWSLDNQQIAFVDGSIYVVARDGTNLGNILSGQSSNGSFASSPVWQP